MDPNTDKFAFDLINEGRVVEGYTLIYLRQIRDLLVDLLVETKARKI